MQFNIANISWQQRVHHMEPQQVPYTASEFEEYAVMQGMGRQGGLSM